MARRKLEIKASEEQLKALTDALGIGAPLQIALQRAGISIQTYYYWLAIASIVTTVKTEEELEGLEELANSGVSITNVRELAQAASQGKKSGVGIYIEPSAESVLAYKNSRKFRKFADQCYEIIQNCDKARCEFATIQLGRISRSTDKTKKVNPSGAMWWLERNLPDFFAKPSDKAKEEETAVDAVGVPSIKVEFVDPNTKEQRQRLLDMEEEILKEQKGGNA